MALNDLDDIKNQTFKLYYIFILLFSSFWSHPQCLKHGCFGEHFFVENDAFTAAIVKANFRCEVRFLF